MFHLPARVKRGNVSSALNEIILIILWCNPFVWLSVFFSQLESLYVFVPHCFFVFFMIHRSQIVHLCINWIAMILYCTRRPWNVRIREPTVSPMTTITTAGEKRLWRLDNSGSKRASLPQSQQTKQLTLVLFSIAARRRQETENAWKKVLLATLFARQMFSFWIKPKKLFTGHWVMSDCFATRWT